MVYGRLRSYSKRATHGCPCGYYNHPEKECVCAPGVVQKYLSKISGPLMDRIDLHVEVTPVSFNELSGTLKTEDSASIRERVICAREIQEKRFAGKNNLYANAQMEAQMVQEICIINEAGKNLLNRNSSRITFFSKSRAFALNFSISFSVAISILGSFISGSINLFLMIIFQFIYVLTCIE